MSALSSFILEAFTDHLSFLSVDAVIDGVVYKALPAEAQIMPQLEIGGVSDQSDGGVIIKKSDFSNGIPKVGTIMNVDGVQTRISIVVASAGNPLVGLEYEGRTER